MSNSKKVIFISYDGMTDPLGQSQVLPYIKYLSDNGFDFHLISCEKEKNFEQHKNKIQGLCDQSNIIWRPQKYASKIPIVSAIINVRRMKKEAKKIVASTDIKIIHARSYIPAIIALAFKFRYSTKFLFDMRGFWPDERVDGKLWNKNKFPFKQVYNYFKKKEIQFIQNADHIISLTHNAKTEIESWKLNKRTEDLITVIPCCADLNHFNYNNKDIQKIKQYKVDLKLSEDDYVLTYLGSLGTWYLLDEMLDFFKELLISKPNAIFLFITKDDSKLVFDAILKKGIPKKAIRVLACERENLPSLLSTSHASIFFITPAYSKKASSPTKMAELLGMGIPIICNDNVGDSNYFLNKESCGVLLEQLNQANYRDAILKIDEITLIPKQDLYNFSENNFSLEIGANRYLNVYNSLMN